MAGAKSCPACRARGHDTSPRGAGRGHTIRVAKDSISRVKAMSRLRPPPWGPNSAFRDLLLFLEASLRGCPFRLTNPGVRMYRLRPFVRSTGLGSERTPRVDPRVPCRVSDARRKKTEANRADRPTGALRVAGNPPQSGRSDVRRRGRGAVRWRTASWCRNARFSNTKERWVLTPRRRPMRMRVSMPAIIDQAGRKSTLTRRTE
jgi:hypothetical protein